MTDKPTDEALENLFVEETGFDIDDFPAAIFDFARAVLAKWGTPAPVGVALSDDLRDRLVAISEAIADQDDRAAQAMLREILNRIWIDESQLHDYIAIKLVS